MPVPILGSKIQLARGARYAVQLITSEGTPAYFAANFDTPVGPNGVVDIAANAAFNPMAQLLSAVELAILHAHRLIKDLPRDATGNPISPLPTFRCLGGINVVPAHVARFRFLGEVLGDDGISILIGQIADDGVRQERYVYAPGHFLDEGPTPVSAPPVYGGDFVDAPRPEAANAPAADAA